MASVVRLNLSILLFAITSVVLSFDFPDCSDPSSYTVYPRSTKYKGLHNTISYDNSNHTENCSLPWTQVIPLDENATVTCGDCDFLDAPSGQWIRFPDPFNSIEEYENDICGHKERFAGVRSCNGFSQLGLARNTSVPTNHTRCVHFNIVRMNVPMKDGTNCSILNDDALVERFDCGDFFLYRMPDNLDQGYIFCFVDADIENATADEEMVDVRKHSFCLVDDPAPLTLSQNRLYYSGLDEVSLTCSVHRSPHLPSRIVWAGLPADAVTSDPSPPTPTSRISAAALPATDSSSVTCTSGSISTTFYKFNLYTYGRIFNSTKDKLIVCVVRTQKYDLDRDLFLVDETGTYYNPLNMTDARGGDSMWILVEGVVHSVVLRFSKSNLASMLLHSSRTWHCALRDPMTGEMVARRPFIVQREKEDQSVVLYVVVGVCGGIVVIAVVGLLIWMVRRKLGGSKHQPSPAATKSTIAQNRMSSFGKDIGNDDANSNHGYVHFEMAPSDQDTSPAS